MSTDFASTGAKKLTDGAEEGKESPVGLSWGIGAGLGVLGAVGSLALRGIISLIFKGRGSSGEGSEHRAGKRTTKNKHVRLEDIEAQDLQDEQRW